MYNTAYNSNSINKFNIINRLINIRNNIIILYENDTIDIESFNAYDDYLKKLIGIINNIIDLDINIKDREIILICEDIDLEKYEINQETLIIKYYNDMLITKYYTKIKDVEIEIQHKEYVKKIELTLKNIQKECDRLEEILNDLIYDVE